MGCIPILILSIGTMMTGNKFNADQIQALLDELNTTGSGWHIDKGKVTKQFVFNDFSTAFGFMTLCAIYAEKINHHPEWFNVYNKVNVQLMTHEVSGISDKDADLAKQMDLYAYKLAKQ